MKKTQFEPRLTKQCQHVYYHWCEGKKKNKQKQNITKQKTRKKAGGIRD